MKPGRSGLFSMRRAEGERDARGNQKRVILFRPTGGAAVGLLEPARLGSRRNSERIGLLRVVAPVLVRLWLTEGGRCWRAALAGFRFRVTRSYGLSILGNGLEPLRLFPGPRPGRRSVLTQFRGRRDKSPGPIKAKSPEQASPPGHREMILCLGLRKEPVSHRKDLGKARDPPIQFWATRQDLPRLIRLVPAFKALDFSGNYSERTGNRRWS